MGTSDYMLLLVVGLFSALFFLVHREDKRTSDRRRQQLPHPVERRVQERRRRGLVAYLGWVLRARWSKRQP